MFASYQKQIVNKTESNSLGFSQQSRFQQPASATVETTSGPLIMILLAQYHLMEKNVCKVSQQSSPQEPQFSSGRL